MARIAPQRSPRRLAVASGVMFFANGAIYGNWIPRLPEIKDRLEVTNSGLGVALLGGGIGGLVGSLVVGAIMSRWGSRRLAITTLYVLPVVMVFVAFVGEPWMLLLVLSAIGIFDVCADVAVNAQGVIAQEQLGRSIMNRLHGLWSLGFATGTLVGSLCAGLQVDLRVQVIVVAVLILVAVQRSAQWLEPTDSAHHTDDFRPDSRRHLGFVALVLAVVAAGAIALEGIPNEWGALLMRDVFGSGSWAGFGTAAFGIGMLLGRFSGDHVQERIGARHMFQIATALIAIGLISVVLTSISWVALVGLFLSGVGQSVIFPRLYLLAARVPGMSAGAGLGALMVGLRIGGMATTLGMGALADAFDVRWALGVVSLIAFALLIAANASFSRRVAV